MNFQSWKIRLNEKEWNNRDNYFYIEIEGDKIFFSGGDMEGCLPIRLLPNIIKFLTKAKNNIDNGGVR